MSGVIEEGREGGFDNESGGDVVAGGEPGEGFSKPVAVRMAIADHEDGFERAVGVEGEEAGQEHENPFVGRLFFVYRVFGSSRICFGRFRFFHRSVCGLCIEFDALVGDKGADKGHDDQEEGLDKDFAEIVDGGIEFHGLVAGSGDGHLGRDGEDVVGEFEGESDQDDPGQKRKEADGGVSTLPDGSSVGRSCHTAGR